MCDQPSQLPLEQRRVHLAPNHGEDHERLRAFILRLNSDGCAFVHGFVLVQHVLQLQRAHLDPAEVHRVVRPAVRLEVTAVQPLHLITMSSQSLTARPGRAIGVVDVLVVLVEKRLRQPDRRGDQKQLARSAFAHRLTRLFEDPEVEPQRRGGKGRRRSGLDDRARDVTAADLGAPAVLDDRSAVAGTTHEPQIVLTIRRLTR